MNRNDKIQIIEHAIELIRTHRNNFMCNALESARCDYFNEHYSSGYYTKINFPELFGITHTCESNSEIWNSATIYDEVIDLTDENHRSGRVNVLRYLLTKI